ncbi:porin [Jannaschia donghaensis]|uniref:Porin n=1 Tax=Jannaschia donghaensis TaxID=420998 RepID=A0A0M6YHY2_9RHOB|nr:porin [Jannaschia donghaensis]CTQ49389.1 Porin [Jannaschia donghaensis]
MKNVLFASTALVAFAGVASAEITLSGNAEMGLISGDGGVASTDNDVEFFTDIDVTFTMSGETDGGLTFGASIDLDESDGSNNDQGIATLNSGPDGIFGTEDDFVTTPGSGGASGAFSGRSQGGETIFLSGAFGTLTAGDTDGALDWALTEVNFNSGSINDDETEHAGFNGNSGLDGAYDGQIVRYDYSFGDFGVALSAELDDNDDTDNDAILGIGFKYQLDLGGTDIGFGLGYQAAEQEGDDADIIAVSLNASFGGGFTAGINYSDFDLGTDDVSGDHIGVGVGYSTGAISANLNYGQYDFDDGTDQDGLGLSVGYDLGGGAVVQLGYGDSNFSDADDFETVSFGVRMNF